jgi:hypothetical protein
VNEKSDGGRSLRRGGALALATAVAVLVTGCGAVHVHFGPAGDPAPAQAPTYAQELALAKCMRAYGVPTFPDPNPEGGYTLTSTGSIKGTGGSSINISNGQAQAAYGDCRHLMPGGPSISQLEQDVQQAQQRQARELPQLLKWQQCVRSHGEPDFTLGLGGQSPASGNGGAFNPNSPQFRAALSSCAHLLPAGAHVSIGTNGSRS